MLLRTSLLKLWLALQDTATIEPVKLQGAEGGSAARAAKASGWELMGIAVTCQSPSMRPVRWSADLDQLMILLFHQTDRLLNVGADQTTIGDQPEQQHTVG